MSDSKPKEFMTPQDVADMLDMSPNWVRDHAAPPPGKKPRRTPVIPVIRLGSRQRSELRFRRVDVLAFIDRHYIAAAPERA